MAKVGLTKSSPPSNLLNRIKIKNLPPKRKTFETPKYVTLCVNYREGKELL